MNQVVPCRERTTSVKGEVELGDFAVDQEGLPELVARGVVPFEYLRRREDFGERFAGCTEPAHVLDVLRSEGWFPRPLIEDVDFESDFIERMKLPGVSEKDRAAAVIREREKREGWRADYDRRCKAARERVRKRRSRAESG